MTSIPHQDPEDQPARRQPERGCGRARTDRARSSEPSKRLAAAERHLPRDELLAPFQQTLGFDKVLVEARHLRFVNRLSDDLHDAARRSRLQQSRPVSTSAGRRYHVRHGCAHLSRHRAGDDRVRLAPVLDTSEFQHGWSAASAMPAAKASLTSTAFVASRRSAISSTLTASSTSARSTSKRTSATFAERSIFGTRSTSSSGSALRGQESQIHGLSEPILYPHVLPCGLESLSSRRSTARLACCSLPPPSSTWSTAFESSPHQICMHARALNTVLHHLRYTSMLMPRLLIWLRKISRRARIAICTFTDAAGRNYRYGWLRLLKTVARRSTYAGQSPPADHPVPAASSSRPPAKTPTDRRRVWLVGSKPCQSPGTRRRCAPTDEIERLLNSSRFAKYPVRNPQFMDRHTSPPRLREMRNHIALRSKPRRARARPQARRGRFAGREGAAGVSRTHSEEICRSGRRGRAGTRLSCSAGRASTFW